ncbi:MAG: histidinol dehydrogenase [Flavobacteriaceae bacterium]|nr:MAG: histidinol dehydrogenase [Flavobacteriaceae bacterium]
MKQITFENLNQMQDQLQRPSLEVGKLNEIIADVFLQIKQKKDQALIDFTQKFDSVSLDKLLVGEDEIEQAKNLVDPELKQAITTAYQNISLFHQAQKIEPLTVETSKGVICQRKARAIEKVGLYIPGGTAPLFSTVLMLAIPAKIAGCKEIILCSPPNKQGNIHPAILFAADLCGVTQIFKVGGAQGVAALALGTESIPKVDKIFGPGNQYVTAAKQFASLQSTAIDMPAGPSEVMVVADQSANSVFVAADLLSQAEHGADSQVVLVSWSDEILLETQNEIQKQLSDLPRAEIAKKSLENAVFVKTTNQNQALEIVNFYAPEHLILATEDQKTEDYFVENVQNAGSVFIGNYTPESAGDYASGTNHTLPTAGYAKQYSGVSLQSFEKYITYQKISKEGLQNLGPTIEIMAQNEELFAHKNAVSLRLKAISEKL